MFGWFKKKDPAPKVRDIVYKDQEAKWRALLAEARKEPTPLFIAWFDDSLEKLQRFFSEHGQDAELLSYKHAHKGSATGRPLIFIEHYPLAEKEQQVFAALGADVHIFSSLDEGFFKLFGGERISVLLDKIGMEENEGLSHSMITKAIRNAQDKIASKLTLEQSAGSMEEWMHKNTNVSSNDREV
jgi:hypothetical protein